MSCLTSIQGLDLELFVGDLEIKQGYVGNKLVYNSGSIVRYYIDENDFREYELERDAECIPAPFTPTMSGWTFVGWRENNTPSSEVLTSKKVGRREDIKLYAVFERDITLTLYNASTTPEVRSATQYYNNSVITTPAFTLTENNLTGWSPIGWTKNTSTYEKTIDNNSEVKLWASSTYYSLYDQDITITTYNGENTSNSETKKRITTFNSDAQKYQNPSFDLNQTSISGLTSLGWVNSSSTGTVVCQPTGTITDVTSNQTYYTTYNKQYTVTLYNGSTTASYLYPKSRLIYGTSTTEEMPNVTLTLATLSSGDYKNKYGWTTGANYTKQYNDGASVKITGNMTFYSLYYKVVTLNMYNGGSTLTKQTGNRYRRYGTSISDDPTLCSFKLTETAISGWSSTGWNTGADNKTATVANGGAVNLGSDATYYSLYHQQFTVTYYNNSSTASSKTAHRYARAYSGGWARTDDTFAGLLPAQTGISGWSARGWSTSTAADGATISTSSVVSANTTLYGSYQRTVTVTYNGNNSANNTVTGTTGNNNKSTATAYRAYNGTYKDPTITFAANGFTKYFTYNRNNTTATNAYWTFLGWTKSTSNVSLINSYSGHDDLTVYAFWMFFPYRAQSGKKWLAPPAFTKGTVTFNTNDVTIALSKDNFSDQSSNPSHAWNFLGFDMYQFTQKTGLNNLAIDFANNGNNANQVAFSLKPASLSGGTTLKILGHDDLYYQTITFANVGNSGNPMFVMDEYCYNTGTWYPEIDIQNIYLY